MRPSVFLEKMRDHKTRLIAIGTSAGGVDALRALLPAFKKPSSLSVVVVIHLPPEGPNLIPSLFQELCEFKIKEADSGETLEKETIYIAPANYHLSVERNETISLSVEPPLNYSRPSIDILFESSAHAFGSRCLGILLTGANADGAIGLHLIHKRNGLTVAQDEKDAEYPTMPLSAIRLFDVDLILSLQEINHLIHQMGHKDV